MEVTQNPPITLDTSLDKLSTSSPSAKKADALGQVGKDFKIGGRHGPKKRKNSGKGKKTKKSMGKKSKKSKGQKSKKPVTEKSKKSKGKKSKKGKKVQKPGKKVEVAA